MRPPYKLLNVPWLTIIVLIAVLWLTLAPVPEKAPHIELFAGADKVIHALMMFSLAGAAMYDYRRSRRDESRWSERRAVWVIALIVAMFSAFDEWMQSLMGMGRSGDPLDFAADLVGILLAVLVIPPLLNRRKCD